MNAGSGDATLPRPSPRSLDKGPGDAGRPARGANWSHDDTGPGVIVLVALLGVLALAGWLGFAALATLGF
jgi:hypothetical protein